RFADPGPLGLCSFALTTLLFSFTNARAMGVEKENIVAGLAFFYGGFIQFVAGVLAFIAGDTFGCCAFASYGGFWMSWGAIHTDAFGIRSAYGDDVQQFNNAMGFFNISWAILTFMMALCTLKGSCYFCSLLWLVVVVFTVNGTSKFTNSVSCARAGGVLGVIAAFLAFFIAFNALSTEENSYIHIRTIMMP
ncbi:acetate uptake transporter family protein ASCRUDRAFT_26005, partial [Ascoidea rubescens DSM 1968]